MKLVKNMIEKTKSRFNWLFSGSERTRIVKENIRASFLIKGISVLVTLFLVPFTIDLLDQEKYGIWITIFSIVSWFNMMDIGIGNGFRNKFADAVALNKIELAKEYVQTLYSSMGLLACLFIIIFIVVNPFLNWYSLLNLNSNFNENIGLIFLVVFVLFCIQLYTKNISTVLLSLQKTAKSNSLSLFSNLLSIILIFTLQQLNFVSLFSISISFMISPIVVNIFFTINYFNGEMSLYKPKLFTTPKKKYLKDLLGLGLKFFLIQITTIVMFSSGNIIISHLFTPALVTPYNVAFRLFGTALSIFAIIVTPFWSAYTEANARKDFVWIKKSMQKLILIWSVFSIGVMILWFISPIIIDIWIGKNVVVPSMLSLQFAFYTIIISWTSLFVSYINGVGKIRIQLIIAVIQFIINIPLAILLARNLNLGLSGVIMATNICLLIPAILIPIQYKKLIKENAYGIWCK
jgi:O-antigen/teichoic acid export membrane protein